jgi:hypothetical protein
VRATTLRDGEEGEGGERWGGRWASLFRSSLVSMEAKRQNMLEYVGGILEEKVERWTA